MTWGRWFSIIVLVVLVAGSVWWIIRNSKSEW